MSQENSEPAKRATDILKRITNLTDIESALSEAQPAINLSNFAKMDKIHRHKEKTDAGHASILFQRLMNQVTTFESELADDEEIGGHLASFGASVLIRIHKISYDDPFFIVFSGKLEGGNNSVKLVQHCSQINVLFTAMKRNDNSQPPRRIGFDAVAQNDH